MNEYEGARWLKSVGRVPEISELGAEVAGLLGDLFRGIYHIPTITNHPEVWRDTFCVTVTLPGMMETYDDDMLTRLVVLCHDRCFRAAIAPCSPGYLRVRFWKRQREGRTFERCPTMEEHIAEIRADVLPPFTAAEKEKNS